MKTKLSRSNYEYTSTTKFITPTRFIEKTLPNKYLSMFHMCSISMSYVCSISVFYMCSIYLKISMKTIRDISKKVEILVNLRENVYHFKI
jgi:hypothetical protein